MAVIRSFVPSPGNGKQQPTEVDSTWSVVEGDDGVLFQMSTFGSDDRASEKKVSQTFQVGKEIALQLRDALNKTFELN